VGGQEVTSAITKGSVEQLKLKAGDQVVVIVKATEVMIGK
jgi:molybdopterin-binding protein